jgi:hypothetical protein
MPLCPVLCPPASSTEFDGAMNESGSPLFIVDYRNSSILCRMSLILRAANLFKQGVTGPNPITSTNFLLSFTELN